MAFMPDDYQIPDDPDTGRMDAAYLRSCLGLRTLPGETPPDLPPAVRQVYYHMARSLSVLGAMGKSMTPTQLATVVTLALLSGATAEEVEPTYSFLDEVVAGRVPPGQKVVLQWRNKERVGHYLRATDDRIIVLHDGDERSIRPDLVRWPQDGEFPEAAENINQR